MKKRSPILISMISILIDWRRQWRCGPGAPAAQCSPLRPALGRQLALEAQVSGAPSGQLLRGKVSAKEADNLQQQVSRLARGANLGPSGVLTVARWLSLAAPASWRLASGLDSSRLSPRV